jgi:hypothetical protein
MKKVEKGNLENIWDWSSQGNRTESQFRFLIVAQNFNFRKSDIMIKVCLNNLTIVGLESIWMKRIQMENNLIKTQIVHSESKIKIYEKLWFYSNTFRSSLRDEWWTEMEKFSVISPSSRSQVLTERPCILALYDQCRVLLSFWALLYPTIANWIINWDHKFEFFSPFSFDYDWKSHCTFLRLRLGPRLSLFSFSFSSRVWLFFEFEFLSICIQIFYNPTNVP